MLRHMCPLSCDFTHLRARHCDVVGASWTDVSELPTRYATNITFLPDGSAATTGSFTNVDLTFPGEVRFHAAEAVTRTSE